MMKTPLAGWHPGCSGDVARNLRDTPEELPGDIRGAYGELPGMSGRLPGVGAFWQTDFGVVNALSKEL